MVSGESSCLEGSEYVRQRGKEVFKAELWAAEVDPLFKICCLSHSANLHPIAFMRLEHGLRYWDSRFYLFQSDRPKIGGVTLIRNTSDFFVTLSVFGL